MKIRPLSWRALVAETRRRRKAEKLTQRQHAALAKVSIPTIAAFDRGESTLTLTKAFDILRVVGLVDEPIVDKAREAFLRAALARWRKRTKPLPKNSPGRFPHGWYRIDYALEGDFKQAGLSELLDILRQAAIQSSGWPPFCVPLRPALMPREIDGTIECWLPPDETGLDKSFTDAAHCDFWQASPAGRMFLIRGYQEDGQEAFAPGTLFDTTLPIWRLGEALLHAARIAELLKQDPESAITVRFRALYAGLKGRVLRSWDNPLYDLPVEGGAARNDEAMLEAVIPADKIEDDLAQHLLPLVAALYEQFGITGVTIDQVKSVTDLIRKQPAD